MEIDEYLSEDQKKYKKRLKWRVIRNPKLWTRLNKRTISDDLEDQIISMLIIKMDDIEGIVKKYNQGNTYGRYLHMEYDIKIGNFCFWNANHPFGSADFSIIEKSKNGMPSLPRGKHIPGRRLALCFKDLVDMIKDYEESISNEPIEEAVADSVISHYF